MINPPDSPLMKIAFYIVVVASVLIAFMVSVGMNVVMFLKYDALVQEYNALAAIPHITGCYFPSNESMVIQLTGRSYTEVLETFNHEWEHHAFKREHFERCELYRESNNSMG